jgi:molecular chaperone DnaK
MSNLFAVGIDLGTTHTVAARVNAAGHSEILRDREGECLVPSVVLFDVDRTVVGQEARLRGRSRASYLAACPKRDMGQPYYHQPINGLRVPPEVLQACILNQLRLSLLYGLGNEGGVVITVPAHFNEAQRQATAAAGEMAGLRVLDIMNEPVAAVVAYGEHTPLFDPQVNPAAPARFLIYDLGGYTFEATLIEIADGTIRTVATDHLPDLGGHDWDMRLADRFAECFIREHEIDPRDTAAGLDVLLQLAVRAKVALSLRSHTTVSLTFEGKISKVRVTRAEFEEMTADLLDKTLALCARLFATAGWKTGELTQLLLVGGATRMPMISQALRKKFGKEPDGRISPDEAVARGAALFAANLLQVGEAIGRMPHFDLINVSTHSLGIEGVDPDDGRKINKILLPRGTPLPAKVTRDFATRQNNQHSIIIKVLEGESTDPEKCVLIGRVAIRNLPPDMTDQWPVEVTYAYNSQGRISVEARIRYTDRVVHLETARVGSVSEAHRARWKQVVMAAPGFASYQEMDRWVHAVDAPPPVVLVSSPEESPADEESTVKSFLRRLMPFAFRQSPAAASQEVVEETQD